MTTLVTGSRTIRDYQRLQQVLAEAPFEIKNVMTGGAVGVDGMMRRYCAEHGLPPPAEIKPNYDKYAGHIAPTYRNWQMGLRATNTVGLWDGFSAGTARQIAIAAVLKLPVHVEIADPRLLDALQKEFGEF